MKAEIRPMAAPYPAGYGYPAGRYELAFDREGAPTTAEGFASPYEAALYYLRDLGFTAITRESMTQLDVISLAAYHGAQLVE